MCVLGKVRVCVWWVRLGCVCVVGKVRVCVWWGRLSKVSVYVCVGEG